MKIENEPIAINEKPLQERDYRELYHKILRSGLVAIAYVLLVFIVVYDFFVFFVGLFYQVLNFAPLITGSIALLFLIFFPRILAKIRYKQYLTMTNGGSFPRSTLFYSDHLEIMTNGAATGSYSYSQVKRAFTTPSLYIIRLPNLVCHMVRLDGFTEGSLDTVRAAVEGKQSFFF